MATAVAAMPAAVNRNGESVAGLEEEAVVRYSFDNISYCSCGVDAMKGAIQTRYLYCSPHNLGSDTWCTSGAQSRPRQHDVAGGKAELDKRGGTNR